MPPRTLNLTACLAVACVAAATSARGAEVAADQRQVAIGYERLETLALRIADAVEASDPARAEQVRAAIGKARSAELGDRFQGVVDLLERERFAAARRDQTELATQLEELLRLVMADPNEARLQEERERLEKLQREIRSALREQRALRARASRGEIAENAARQAELARRVERLQEPAEATDRLTRRGEPADEEAEASEDGQRFRSIAGPLKAGAKSMHAAGKKLAGGEKAADEQREAQRELEAAQREAEERLRQLREEERQRRLASLAERFRRMHEAQVGVTEATEERVEGLAGAQLDRPTRLAAARLAEREAEVGAAARKALRVVRADGSSLVFDQALAQLIDDLEAVESRLREPRLDRTTVQLERSVVDALSEMIAAVDESLDELEQQRAKGGQGGKSGGGGGASRLVSKIAELKMIRSVQARLLRQTDLWASAAESGEAAAAEVAQRLGRLAGEQRRLAAAAAKAAKDGS